MDRKQKRIRMCLQLDLRSPPSRRNCIRALHQSSPCCLCCCPAVDPLANCCWPCVAQCTFSLGEWECTVRAPVARMLVCVAKFMRLCGARKRGEITGTPWTHELLNLPALWTTISTKQRLLHAGRIGYAFKVSSSCWRAPRSSARPAINPLQEGA